MAFNAITLTLGVPYKWPYFKVYKWHNLMLINSQTIHFTIGMILNFKNGSIIGLPNLVIKLLHVMGLGLWYLPPLSTLH